MLTLSLRALLFCKWLKRWIPDLDYHYGLRALLFCKWLKQFQLRQRLICGLRALLFCKQLKQRGYAYCNPKCLRALLL